MQSGIQKFWGHALMSRSCQDLYPVLYNLVEIKSFPRGIFPLRLFPLRSFFFFMSKLPFYSLIIKNAVERVDNAPQDLWSRNRKS